MLKIRRSHPDCLIFNTGIPYLEKTVFILRRGPVHHGVSHEPYQASKQNGLEAILRVYDAPPPCTIIWLSLGANTNDMKHKMVYRLIKI